MSEREKGDARMLRRAIIAVGILWATGCCKAPATAVHDQATSIRKLTQPSLVLIDRCAKGEQPACDIVKTNLQAIDASAAQLETPK
jgi:hypothetical protein